MMEEDRLSKAFFQLTDSYCNLSFATGRIVPDKYFEIYAALDVRGGELKDDRAISEFVKWNFKYKA